MRRSILGLHDIAFLYVYIHACTCMSEALNVQSSGAAKVPSGASRTRAAATALMGCCELCASEVVPRVVHSVRSCERMLVTCQESVACTYVCHYSILTG